MNILITGGTGLIGRALTKKFVEDGHQITIKTRKKKLSLKSNESIQYINALDEITEGASPEIIINLAGEPISKRWTKSRKVELINSRVQATRELISYIKNLETKPRLLVSGSAIGYYGTDGHTEFTEESEPFECFTHEVCSRWEL